MFSTEKFLWLTYYCPQNSKNDPLLHLFTTTTMFIKRRRITMYGGMSKSKNWWSSRPVISVPDARPLFWKKKRVVVASFLWLKQRVLQASKGTQVRAETLHLWPILCVAYWNQENPTPEFKGICYWIFAGIFSPTKGDGINNN